MKTTRINWKWEKLERLAICCFWVNCDREFFFALHIFIHINKTEDMAMLDTIHQVWREWPWQWWKRSVIELLTHLKVRSIYICTYGLMINIFPSRFSCWVGWRRSGGAPSESTTPSTAQKVHSLEEDKTNIPSHEPSCPSGWS